MQITHIRLAPSAAEEALKHFVFGGHYGPVRPPRGIAPAQVSAFVKTQVLAEGDEDDFAKTLELVRFYESKDVVDPMLRLLAARPPSPSEFRRQTVIIQVAGDLGESAEIRHAREHLETKLVPSNLAAKHVPDLLACYLTLAPAGSLEVIEKRLKEEQARLAPLQGRSDNDLMAYDQVTAYLRNDLERTRQSISAKAKYAALPLEAGLPRLVNVYLGAEGSQDPYLQVWAARRVRAWAMMNSPDPAKDEFYRTLGTFTAETLKTSVQLQARYWRAESAFRYFGGAPDAMIRALSPAAKARTLDFLDDSD